MGTATTHVGACHRTRRWRILPPMAQQPVELILVRHLASRLAVPVFVVDPSGDLVYFNEPAERVLGRRYDAIRFMPFEEWTTAFVPAAAGRTLAVEELPLVVALRKAIPAHSRFDIISGDRVRRTIEVTAFPIIAPTERLLGAVAMFWETDER
jgi:PAS domain-containing protein